jgi:hypothetical protein
MEEFSLSFFFFFFSFFGKREGSGRQMKEAPGVFSNRKIWKFFAKIWKKIAEFFFINVNWTKKKFSFPKNLPNCREKMEQ